MRKLLSNITTIMFLLFLPALALAQTATATLRGTVEDSSGKTLPSATAILTRRQD